jgi:peptidoglycan/LPS O-acetylase OafA/YrhL
MTGGATAFITYLWHYLVARLLYEHLLRPLIHDRVSALALVCVAVLAAFAIGWWSARRRPGARRRV